MAGKKTRKPKKEKEETTKQTQETPYCTLTYIGRIIDQISRILRTGDIKLAYRPTNTVYQLIGNPKEKRKPNEKNGVYELKCKDCAAIYIGETGRPIDVRIKEHLNPQKYSAMGNHLREQKHQLDTENVKILHQEKKGRKLILLEAMKIYRRKEKQGIVCLNEQVELKYNPIFKTLIRKPKNVTPTSRIKPTISDERIEL